MGFHTYSSPYDWSRVAQYKQIARGVDGGMIDLSIGSPVDPVPQSVQQSLVESADEINAHGYPATKGTADVQQAIETWLRDCRDIQDLAGINGAVVPTVGSKEAVALMASLLFLGEGDVVVQPRMAYPTYEIGTQIAGATVLKVDDVADIDSWVHTPGVKAVWVNSPNNPTGTILNAEQMRAIVEAARSINAVVLSDECYALMDWSTPCKDAIVQGDSMLSSVSALHNDVCSGSSSNILVLYSLSKQSNMAGYRTAFIAGDANIVNSISDYRKQIGQMIPGPVQAAMVAGLQDREAVRIQYMRYYKRMVTLVDALQAYGYEVSMPEGALYVWARALTGDCWSDMEKLAEIGILPSPGEFYGSAQYLRFSVTASDAEIEEAARRLRA